MSICFFFLQGKNLKTRLPWIRISTRSSYGTAVHGKPFARKEFSKLLIWCSYCSHEERLFIALRGPTADMRGAVGLGFEAGDVNQDSHNAMDF